MPEQVQRACMQVDFLYELVRLDEVAALSGSDSDSPGRAPNELPERRAARGLFRWDVSARPLPFSLIIHCSI